jgi:hypothetical protein
MNATNLLGPLDIGSTGQRNFELECGCWQAFTAWLRNMLSGV